jgi:predicted metal-dependent hydrolase
MGNTISYGTTNIKYSVERRNRKTLAIEVHPDNTVWVIAPIDANDEEIQSRVEKKAPWIAKQQRFFNGRPEKVIQPEWVSGENIFYLGRQYRLKIHVGEADVKLAGKYLNVTVKDKEDKKKIADLVNTWYLKHARIKFEERMALLHPILERENLKMNSLMIRKLEKRWGSCTAKGNIVVNADLIKAPINCIDYVLIHELCHLKYHDHSNKFWTLLNKYCPDWVKTKERLEKFNF